MVRRRKNVHVALALLAALAILAAVVIFGARSARRSASPASAPAKITVLSYSAFLGSWGPGPEIIRLFKEQTGISVEIRDGGDAGLLLKKLELFPSDAVVGLDQMALYQAREGRKWRPIPQLKGEPNEFREFQFVAYDWSPFAFVFRPSESTPPTSLDDLLNPRYKGAIALQDPRQSSPGLQFFFWVLDTKGVEEGFQYFTQLKANVHSVSPSWSASYGLFIKRQAKMVFSYLTSPIYHEVVERDVSFRAALFASGQPVQVEYAAVPGECVNCEGGERFVRFLLKPEIQKLIMEKNAMFPVDRAVMKDTPFANAPIVEPYLWKNLPELLLKREELFERWRSLGL